MTPEERLAPIVEAVLAKHHGHFDGDRYRCLAPECARMHFQGQHAAHQAQAVAAALVEELGLVWETRFKRDYYAKPETRLVTDWTPEVGDE